MIASSTDSKTEPHFTFTGATQVFAGHTVHQIKARINLPHAGVVAGDIGGWVETTDSLRDNAWIFDDACVYQGAQVTGDAIVRGNVAVFGHAHIGESAVVEGSGEIRDYARVYGCAQVQGRGSVVDHSHVYGWATVSENATVSEGAQIYGHAHVAGNAAISGGAHVCGQSHIAGSATLSNGSVVCGHAVITGEVAISGGAQVSATARIEHYDDILIINRTGLVEDTITVFRTDDQGSSNHVIAMGKWRGTIESLQFEISHPRHGSGERSDFEQDRLQAEVHALIPLLNTRIEQWRSRVLA
ncbi:hypothetical protein CMUST_12940 [Corynebacterium mustelae]|uniref:Uncharacterized protein n=2 Tax=Corynebacterium mustelae TaxID=571915 RepID=A0A0G3H0E5_9CORY|nr:hypothetical protein CMUST_12940 [Corynebacterium mustelae]